MSQVLTKQPIAELDALRGVAIFLVFSGHLFPFFLTAMVPAPNSPLSWFIILAPAGFTGVTLFFVLSAFLLSQPLINGYCSGTQVDLMNFVRRRVLRIIPLFWTTVVVVGIILGEYWKAFQALIFLPDSGTGLLPYGAVWWSLQVEVQFYILLIFSAWLMRYSLGRKILLIALMSYGIAYTAFCLGFLTPHHLGLNTFVSVAAFLHTVLQRGPVFILGIFAAWLFLTKSSLLQAVFNNERIGGFFGYDLLLLLMIGLLSLLLNFIVQEGIFPSELKWPAWHIAEGILWALIMFIILYSPLRLKKLIVNRPMIFLGKVSYSFYLMHFPLIYFLVSWLQSSYPEILKTSHWNATSIAVCLGIFLLCVAVSSVTYQCIERPFLQRKRNLKTYAVTTI